MQEPLFKKIYSKYLKKFELSRDTELSLKQKEHVRRAMEDAKSSFQSIMEIQHKLDDAYRSVIEESKF